MSHLVVAGGGPEASDEELLAIVERFKDMARNLAGEVGYAFVSVEPKFSAFVASTQPTGCGERSGDLELLCDEVVFDAFPYQIRPGI